MAYEPKYSIPSGATPVKTSEAPVIINGKIIPGYQTTFSDGTSKWIRYEDASLSSNFDFSTFTGTKNSDGKWVWSPTTDRSIPNLAGATGLTQQQINDGISSPTLQNSLNGNRVIQLGGVSEANKIDPSIPQSSGASVNPNGPVEQGSQGFVSQADFDQENKFKDGTSGAGDYSFNGKDLRYPTDLSTNQDCIKFSIIEYLPPGLGATSNQPRVVTMKDGNPSVGGRTILGTITLPIPGGINDSNGVTWADDSLGSLKGIFADIARSFMGDGGEAAAGAAERGASEAGAGDGLEQTLIGKMTEAATGSSRIMQRQYGSIPNPNLELLFDSPTLRDFTFNFRFTPRTPEEAKTVRFIIRSFKRAMSVKRSISSVLLKSPHTFAISYVTSNQQHPYLNKFKECALTNCSVNYTPDGTYMTYGFGEDIDSRSMTAYEMQLTFKELEPLFDDEYDKGNNIGF
jgi:hypothetical protein